MSAKAAARAREAVRPFDVRTDCWVPRRLETLRGRLRRTWRALGVEVPADLARWPRERLVAVWIAVCERLYSAEQN